MRDACSKMHLMKLFAITVWFDYSLEISGDESLIVRSSSDGLVFLKPALTTECHISTSSCYFR